MLGSYGYESALFVRGVFMQCMAAQNWYPAPRSAEQNSPRSQLTTAPGCQSAENSVAWKAGTKVEVHGSVASVWLDPHRAWNEDRLT